MGSKKRETNARGNVVVRNFDPAGDRYKYDLGNCSAERGWVQYDTKEDAWYFGVWVHPKKRHIFTYAEGDLGLTICPTTESYKAELASMAEFYGDPPPAFTAISLTGQVTKYYDARPE